MAGLITGSATWIGTAVFEPEHERIAATVLLAWLVFGVVGIVTTIGGVSLALIKLAQWALS